MLRPVLTPVLKPVLRPVFYKQEMPPPEQWVARLDGATKYWQLSGQINLRYNDVVEISTVNPTTFGGGFEIIMSDGAAEYQSILRVDPDLSLTNSFGLTEEDGQDVSIFALDGAVHNYNFIVNKSVNLSLLGAQQANSLFIRNISFPVFNFRVTRSGVVTHEIPLTNKDQGATQIATVGSVNATMINHTGDEWEPLQ